MKLPWVSRAEYDELWEQFRAVGRSGERHVTTLLNMSNDNAARAHRAEEEVKRLTDLIVGMKRDNFHPVQVQSTEPRREPDELPDPILEVLDQLGLTGVQLEQHRQWAARRLKKMRNAELVAEELLQGGVMPDEPAEVEA